MEEGQFHEMLVLFPMNSFDRCRFPQNQPGIDPCYVGEDLGSVSEVLGISRAKIKKKKKHVFAVT